MILFALLKIAQINNAQSRIPSDEYLICTNSIMPCSVQVNVRPKLPPLLAMEGSHYTHALTNSAWQSMKAPRSDRWNVCQPVSAKLVHSSELFGYTILSQFKSQRTASWRGMR